MTPPQPHAQQGREPVTPSTEAGRRVGRFRYVRTVLTLDRNPDLHFDAVLRYDDERPNYAPDIANDSEEALLSALEAADRAAGPLDVERLARARDVLAYYLWSEDDADNDDDLATAYDELRAVLGASTEESVGATMRRLAAAEGEPKP